MEEDYSEDFNTEDDTNNDDNNDGLEERVREWLDKSGKKTELQTKLRAELFAAIHTELAFKGDIVATDTRHSSTRRERLINWLISEHLTRNKFWLTNSVLVTEADIETVHQSRDQPRYEARLQQYDTEVVTSETILQILSSLGFNPSSEITNMIVKNKSQKSILTNIVEAVSSAGLYQIK